MAKLEDAEAHRINELPWEPMPGHVKRRCGQNAPQTTPRCLGGNGTSPKGTPPCSAPPGAGTSA